jgi:hypothetical protein
MRRQIAIGLALSVLSACGGSKATPGTAGAAAPASARGVNRDIITRAEIEQTQGVTNVFDLINRLRPHFLRNEGRTSLGAVAQIPLVRLNGSVVGDASILRTLGPAGLEEIRYYSIVEAETKWSGDRGRPVIAVTTRKLTGK